MPSSQDNIAIPVDAGVIRLAADVKISSLDMHGGVILLHDTACEHDWTPGTDSLNGYDPALVFL